MEYIECKSDEEFFSKKTYEPLEFVEMLREKYPTEYGVVYDETAMEHNLELKLFDEFDLFDYVDVDDFIDRVDDEIESKVEVLCEYFVVDECGTDLGVHRFVNVWGYAFLK